MPNSVWDPMQKAMSMAIPIIMQQKELQQKEQARKQQIMMAVAEMENEFAKEQMKIEGEKRKAVEDLMVGQYKNAVEKGNADIANAMGPQLSQLGYNLPTRAMHGPVMPGQPPLAEYLVNPQKGPELSGDAANLAIILGRPPTLQDLMEYRSRGANSVTVNTGNPEAMADLAKKKAFEERGKASVEIESKYRDSAQASRKTMNTLNALESSLNEIDDTGMFTPTKMNIARFARSFGVNIDPQLEEKQQADAFLKEISLQFRNPASGAGMPGAMSDQDRAFLEKISGTLSLEKGSMLRLIQIRRKLAQRNIDEAKQVAKYVKDNGYLDSGFDDYMAQWAEANPIFKDEKPLPAPTTKKMPSIGEVRGGYRFKGGNPADRNSWEKVK